MEAFAQDRGTPEPVPLTGDWVIEQVRDHAMFLIDRHGRIASWNKGVQEILGWCSDDWLGQPLRLLFTPEDVVAGIPERELQQALATGRADDDRWLLRKDGSRFFAVGALSRIVDEAGVLIGFLKVLRDFTNGKRSEQQREVLLASERTARAEAERASRAKDEFLTTISHELRTPLSAILGWAQVLGRVRGDTATAQQGLAAIVRNARMQVQLIEDLLDMNRIELGQLRLDMQPVELADVVMAAVDAAMPSATEAGLALRTTLLDGPAIVLADPSRLQQVIGNLLSNALKFTPRGGRVDVTLSHSEDDGFEIGVVDSGQGIKPEFLGRVFDRFQQQDAGSTRRHGGLGLGLAIVRELMQLHGGSVRVRSDGVGQGATVSVSLPALVTPSAGPGGPEQAADALGDDAPAVPRPLDGITVLLVEDEPDVRWVAVHVLEAAGAQVLTAGNAKDGVERVRRDRPDAIVSDLGMPGHDGYQFLAWVRELDPAEGGRTPAAAFTAYTRPEDRRRAFDAGFQMHLPKPVEPAELVRAVAMLADPAGTRGAGPAPPSGAA